MHTMAELGRSVRAVHILSINLFNNNKNLIKRAFKNSRQQSIKTLHVRDKQERLQIRELD